MKTKFIRFLALVLLVLITPLIATNLAGADTIISQSIDKTKQAAEEVLKDTGAKQIFGKNEKGNKLIDNAKARASQKLDKLADNAESSKNLPDSKKSFLRNLTSQD